MPANSSRMNKINEELKREISNVLLFDFKDPHLTGFVTVTKVKTTPDFRYARVYVSILNSKSNSGTLATLKKSSGFIRTEIAKKLNLRYTPELVFEFDESIEYGAKIDDILKKIVPKE